jgi:serine/threonine protein phosphatase PrpC
MGHTLSYPIKSVYVERHNNVICRSVYSCIHGYRITNEDAHAVIRSQDDVVFNGVFDGHVGNLCANYVAEHLPAKLLKNKDISSDEINARCLEIDKEFLDSKQEGGTTATFSIINKNESDGKYYVSVGNIGDSMTIILDKETGYEPKFFTTDHKPILPNESDRIKRCGGIVNNNRVDGLLAVSRAFGDSEYKKSENQTENKVIACPDVNKIICNEGDIIIHICDGITESNFSPIQLCQFIKINLGKHSDLAVISSLVCLEAFARGSKDNLSCMITVLECASNTVFTKELIPGRIGEESSRYLDAYRAFAQLAEMCLEDVVKKRLELLNNFEMEKNQVGKINLENILLEHSIMKINYEHEIDEEREIIARILTRFTTI